MRASTLGSLTIAGLLKQYASFKSYASHPQHHANLRSLEFADLSTCFVAAMFLTRSGRADQSSATTPATCGPAIDVPLKFE